METEPEHVPSVDSTILMPLSEKHTHTVILLHGREDYGEYFAEDFFANKATDGLSLAEKLPSVKWVFPTAKLRYSAKRDFEFSSTSFAESLKGFEILSQWFDVWEIADPTDKQELMLPGLRESIKDIHEIIREERKFLPENRIILGGISQGCATALFTLLRTGTSIGGFIGLSSWLPFQNEFEHFLEHTHPQSSKIVRHVSKILNLDNTPEVEPTEDTDLLELASKNLSVNESHFRDIPMFLSHSRDDETVPLSYGRDLCRNIKNLGFDVIWKEYDNGGHSLHPDHSADDIHIFLSTLLEK